MCATSWIGAMGVGVSRGRPREAQLLLGSVREARPASEIPFELETFVSVSEGALDSGDFVLVAVGGYSARRRVMRFVAPLVPMRGPAVMTTGVPGCRP